MREIAGVKLYTILETAQLLDITSQTVRKYLKLGKLSGQRIGRPILISEESLRKFLKGETTKAPVENTIDIEEAE